MSIRSRNAFAFVIRTFHTVMLSALPEKCIFAKTSHEIKRFLNYPSSQPKICFTTSGRTALAMLFRYLRQRAAKPIDTVLLPDYICNVVSAAAEYASLRMLYYETSDYAPRMESVERLLNENEDSCVLFASMMGHRCIHEAAWSVIRKSHPETPIVFDECQNIAGLRDAMPVLARVDTYCVVSFNNKMMQGLLGGAVYGIPRESWIFDEQTSVSRGRMQINMAISYIKQNLGLLHEYVTGQYHTPTMGEKSACEGKYCVTPYRIYKISLAAAYLGLRNWESCESTLIDNGLALLNGDGVVRQKVQGNNRIPLYIPVAYDDSLIGRLPLKGRYWTSVPCPQYRDHMYIVVHNTLRVRRS